MFNTVSCCVTSVCALRSVFCEADGSGSSSRLLSHSRSQVPVLPSQPERLHSRRTVGDRRRRRREKWSLCASEGGEGSPVTLDGRRASLCIAMRRAFSTFRGYRRAGEDDDEVFVSGPGHKVTQPIGTRTQRHGGHEICGLCLSKEGDI